MEEKKILVIDDELDIVHIIKFHLERKGYTVFTAHDGEEGLKVARQVQPDLVLLDMNMPKKNGLEFYNEIVTSPGKKMFPVLVLTSRIELEDLFKDIKADGFAPKPIDFEDLLEQMDQILYPKAALKADNKKTKNIMLVENDGQTLDEIALLFIHAGFNVQCAKTPEDAVNHIPTAPLDLLIVNLTLCDVLPSLRKIPKYVRENTMVWIYTRDLKALDATITRKISAVPGMAPAQLIMAHKLSDLLEKAKELMSLK